MRRATLVEKPQYDRLGHHSPSSLTAMRHFRHPSCDHLLCASREGPSLVTGTRLFIFYDLPTSGFNFAVLMIVLVALNRDQSISVCASLGFAYGSRSLLEFLCSTRFRIRVGSFDRRGQACARM